LNPHSSEITNPQKSRDGLDRLVYAVGFSISGLRAAYRHEKAFRLEVWLAAVLLPGAFWLGNGWVEISILAGSVVAVMAAELLNSAVEAVVDRVSTEWHELSGRAKDLGSACVLLMVLMTGGIWISALWSRFAH
jgi:diacylglycerol kinase (ATP)